MSLLSSSNGYTIVIILNIFSTLKEYEAAFSLEEIKLHDEVVLHRSQRQLLFPNVTVLQFNAGVSTPTPIKTINVNWAFQANFVLPWNRTQIPLDILQANNGYVGFSRKIRDVEGEEKKEGDDADGGYNDETKLYHFYKYVEEILNGFGHNGTSCVLQTLCHLGAEPLHTDDDEEDLAHDLATFILNPNHDAEEESLPETHESYPYIQAYNHGRTYRNCLSVYKHCSVSLIDKFSIRKISDSDVHD